jgi:hypothetical protein
MCEKNGDEWRISTHNDKLLTYGGEFFLKESNKRILILGTVMLVAFAFAMVLTADDAEADGDGVATIFPSYVIAGDFYSFEIKYTVPTGGFEKDTADPGWQVTIPSVTEYPNWDDATDPWSKPQDTDVFQPGYVQVEGAHASDVTLTITGRTVRMTYDGTSGLPSYNENLVLRYGHFVGRSQVQLHDEFDVDFFTECDEHGVGNYLEIADHPNADVVPGDPDKIIVTVLGDHDGNGGQQFDPNPYLSPFQIHTDAATGLIKDPAPPNQISGLDFLVEIRLTDRYLNLITEEKGDDELDLQWGSVDSPPDAVPGKSPEPCANSPVIEDSFSVMTDFYAPGAFPYTKNDIPVQFVDGLGIRSDDDFNEFDYFHVTLYKVEEDISLYVKNNQLYEWNTDLFDTKSPFEGTPLDLSFGPCAYDGGDFLWINGLTPIYIDNVEDIPDVTIQYRVWYLGAWTEWQDGAAGEDIEFTMTDLDVGGDCIHYIEYRSFDKYCNFGPTENATVYVDNTDPISSYTILGPQVVGIDFTWITYGNIELTDGSYITFDCVDYGCDDSEAGPSGNKWTLIRYEYFGDSYPQDLDDSRWGLEVVEVDGMFYFIYEEGAKLWFNTDCERTFYYRNEDNVCNLEDEQTFTVRVDGTAPESDWDSTGDIIYNDVDDIYWVDYETEITVDCVDYGCMGGVGTELTYVRYEWNDDSYPMSDSDDRYGDYYFDGVYGWWIYDGTPIIWEEDCEHVLYYYNVDLLGNEEIVHMVEFWVDGTAPQSTWAWGETGNWYQHDGDDFYWITPGTDIVLRCEDYGCHDGVGTEITYYRWVWDNDGVITYYPMDTTPDAVLVDGEWYLEYDLPITWFDDCIHYLYYRNVDYLGNLEAEHMAMFYVDGTTPISEWGFVPDTGDQIYDDRMDVYWIDYDTEIWLDCTDYGCEEGVGVQYTLWRYEWDNQSFPDATGYDVEIDGVYYWIYVDGEETIWWLDDCVHYLYFLNVDWLGNVEKEWCIEFWVDGTEPVSSWDFVGDGDQIADLEGWWIDYDTGIELFCEDYGCNGGSGDYYEYPTYWYMYYYPEQGGIEIRPIDDTDTEYGIPVMYEGEWYWVYDGPIYFDEDCYHQIWWFNVDPLGNEESIWNYVDFYVDGTAPQSGWDFEAGDHIYDEAGDFYWIDHETLIWVYCEDYGCLGGVGDTFDYTTYWGFNYDDLQGGDPVWRPADEFDTEYGTPVQYQGVWFWETTDIGGIDTFFNFNEDCIHELVFFNVDSLGNYEQPHTVTFKVDGTTPVSSWDFVAVPDSMQIPDVNLAGEPFFWIDYDTQISLTCQDYGCDGGVGEQITYYRYEWDSPQGLLEFPGATTGAVLIEGNWYMPYVGPIYWTEDCEHFLYFLNVDALGNVEDEWCVEFWVDGTVPESNWEFVDDTLPIYDDNGDFWWILPTTEIALICEDYGCNGGVGDVWGNPTYYRWEWDDGTGTTIYPTEQEAEFEIDGVYYVTYIDPIFWADDCIHTLYYLNVDALGNTEKEHMVMFKVDGTDPVSSWNFMESVPGETYGDQQYDELGDFWYIDWDTMIEIECEDFGCDDGVGGQITYFRWEWDGNGDGIIDESYPAIGSGEEINGEWYVIYEGPIMWLENCVHKLYFINVDALGNVEDENMVEFHVDGGRDSLPDSWKTIGDPQYENGDWVTSQTLLLLEGSDDSIFCDVGSWRIHWYVDWLNPATGEWEEVDGGVGEWFTPVEVYFAEECYHKLTWWAEDNLGNMEEYHEQWHWVDNTPPATWKTHEGDMYTEDEVMSVEAGLESISSFITAETDFHIPQVLDTDITHTGAVFWETRDMLGTTGGASVGTIVMAQHRSIIAADGPEAGNGYGRGMIIWTDGVDTYTGNYVVDVSGWYDVEGMVYAVGDNGKYVSGYLVGSIVNDVFYGTLTYNFATAVGLNTEITIHGDDLFGPCSVGSYTIHYQYYIDDLGVWTEEFVGDNSMPVTFNFEEDCVHILEWWVVDNLGTESEHYFQEYHVDVTPPTSSKEVGECSYSTGTTSTGNTVDIVFVVDTSASMDGEWAVMDAVLSGIVDDIVASGTDLSVCIYGLNEDKGSDGNYPNIEAYSELMDITYYNGATQPQIPAVHEDREDWGPGVSWVALFHPWRVDSVRVVIPISDECPFNGGATQDADDIATIAEGIALCNANDVTVYGFYSNGYSSNSLDLMTDLCESTGGEAYYFDETNADLFAENFEGILAHVTSSYVSLQTPLTFTAEDDLSPCMSGFSHYEYRISWDADHNLEFEGSEIAVDWIEVYENPWIFTFTEESLHMIEWRAVDNLGNKKDIHSQYHFVDTLTPVIDRSHSDNFYQVGTNEYFMDTNSFITLDGDDTAGDVAHCVSGLKDLYWRFLFDGKYYPEADGDFYYDDGTEEIVYDIATEKYWYVYNYPIYFTEECEHVLEYFAEDNVCHISQIETVVYYVDKTAPTTILDIGNIGLNGHSVGGDWGYCELFDMTWVEPDTWIWLEAFDEGCLPGGSGVYATYFRIYFEGIGGWTDAIMYDGPFTMEMLEQLYPGISEDSEHILEWFSVDNVGKIEEVQSFTIQVDEAEPEPEIFNPVFDWYYRPGHMIEMMFEENTGDTIVYFEWYYSFDGIEWFLIWEGLGDQSTEVIWDSSVIPDPMCDNGPVKVYIKLVVVDEHCRYGEDINEIWFCKAENPHPCTQVITINQGWNLISIAVELDSLGGDYTASKLAAEINSQAGENIVKYIVRWNKETGKFNEYVVDNAIGYDFAIEKGEGYYVYSLSPFEVDFVIVGDCAECEYIDLDVCWNLVGWDSMEWMWVGDFVDLVNDKAGADVVQAVVRHVSDDEYEAWYPGDDPQLFKLETNNAYWVFVAQPVSDIPLP